MPHPPPSDHEARRDDAAALPTEKEPAAHSGGFTLDLSTGPSSGQPEAWRRLRKQASPILTKIVDLSTPKPAPAPTPGPKQPSAPPAARRREQTDQRGPRGKRENVRGGGATLADLLDEATLARLRGGG